MPLVSVLMPVYNNEKYVQDSIESVLNQTFEDFEFVIVNDGSTDNTLDILKSIRDSRIKLISFTANRGIVDALNEGGKLAQGKYIARQDSDDISLPTRFEKQVSLLESDPDLVLVATRILVFAEDMEENAQSIESFYEHGNTKEEIRELFSRLISPIPHPTVMFRKDAFDELGGYRKEYEYAEDMDLWFRMLKKGEMAKVPEKLVLYRRHPGAICYVKSSQSRDSYYKIINRLKNEGI